MDIIHRFLPKGRKWGRPGYKLGGRLSLTIHNTANESPGADAMAHAHYLEAGHYISWHYTVDAQTIVQHLPTDEQGWHTGTGKGNTTSIGIECCEYPKTAKGRFMQLEAEHRAERLCAWLMKKKGLTSAAIVTHQSWSGKVCPRDILPHWSAFVKNVERNYDAAYRAYPGKLVRGDSGRNTRWVQQRLCEAGYEVAVDSIYGWETYEAVKRFRTKRFGPKQTGNVGLLTWGALARKL